MDRRFYRYELRTTDVVAAPAFYREVLALDAWPSELAVSSLPDAARARGGRSHWLGHVGVERPEALADALMERGATRLGPARRDDDGGLSIPLRDPFGAFVAIDGYAAAPHDPIVAWHHLNTPDADASLALYRAELGWSVRDARLFAWSAEGAVVGSASTIADPTRTHPHWYFFFRVPDLEGALGRVRARGGITLPVVEAASGAHLAACDDPQGAAFGLFAPARR